MTVPFGFRGLSSMLLVVQTLRLASPLVALLLVACTTTATMAPSAPAPTISGEAALAPAHGGFPTSPPLAALREPRGRQTARTREAIVVAIQNLEIEFAAMAPDAPARAAQMGRLLDGYAELARMAQRDVETSLDPARVEKARKMVVAARRAELAYYVSLAKQHPTFCAGTAKLAPGCTDEAVYDLAYAQEKLGQLDSARRIYLALLTDHPQSHYVPVAYLSFGELFVREAEQAPGKWTLAQQSFEEVLKYPWPDNVVFGYALLRLGNVHERLGRAVEARQTYSRLRALAAANPGVPAAEIPAQLAP